MKQVRNLFVAIAILAVLGYVSVYGYMYTKVKSAVDNISIGLMMAGDFDYGGISVSPLSSSFSIDDISFTPNNFRDPLEVDAVKVQLDNLVALMDLSSNFGPNMEFPQQGKISMIGLHMPLEADWVKDLSDEVLEGVEQIDEQYALCGDVAVMGPAQLKEMGYEQILADLSVSYSHEAYVGRMDNFVEVTLHDLARIKYKAITSAPEDRRLMSFARMDDPKLIDTTITYTDLGYVEKELGYCAEASDMQTAELIDARVNQPDAGYAVLWGFVPGAGIREAYRRFLTNPDEITLMMDPSESFSLRTLHLYNPKDIPAVLRLRVAVNDKPVKDLSFKTVEEIDSDGRLAANSKRSLAAGLGELGSMLRTEEEQEQPEQKQEADTPEKIEKPRFRAVALRDINQHLGRAVKVHVAGGLVREGKLERVADSKLFVVRNMHGGKFTVPVPYGKVAKVEVFY